MLKPQENTAETLGRLQGSLNLIVENLQGLKNMETGLENQEEICSVMKQQLHVLKMMEMRLQWLESGMQD